MTIYAFGACFEMMKLLCLAVLSSIILVGCQMSPEISCDVVAEEFAATNRISVVSVQYAASVGNAGAETVEVVLRNGSGNGLQGLS